MAANEPNEPNDDSAENDLEKTVPVAQPSDQTVPDIPAAETNEGSAEDPEATVADLSEQTVQVGDTEQTQTLQPFGIGDEGAEGESIKGDDKTVPNIEATIDMASVQLRPSEHQTQPIGTPPSVMQSSDLSQTINPRELTKDDIAFWGSAALGASDLERDAQTKLPPAIERSVSELKLQITERDLAPPTRDADEPSDYRLVKLLGRGGMGNVYIAKQTSLDRMIAVKVIKPLAKSKRDKLTESGRLQEVEQERRQQFLSEAVVTGDLDHPNIVPIHDIAVAPDSTLFYAMKRVVGEPWSKTIKDQTRDENLEVLLKVCDAIAFAHTRGVVHRDIKPENIMLGDFGEVLVMDWGLALARPEFEKKDSVSMSIGLGGTPAFMAPEMATGPVEKIDTRSDIYLLGATLFYVVTGQAPHKAANVSQCIKAVTANDIQTASPEHHGELLDIALRAMATRPEDRYATVKEFQDAIRSYRAHSESIAISTGASQSYEEALQSSQYESYSRAMHGFEQAIDLWNENKAANDGLSRCRIDYAKAAHANGDLDLGLSLLDPANPRHEKLIAKLNEELRQREQRAGRLKLFRFVAAASLAFILVGGSVALYLIEKQRSAAVSAREDAIAQAREVTRQKTLVEEQREIAVANAADAKQQRIIAEQNAEKEAEQRKLAEANEDQANENLRLANEATKVANAAKDDAQKAETAAKQAEKRMELARDAALKAKTDEERARQAAEYEFYLSQIGLANARIAGNEFDDARRILADLRKTELGKNPAWEWRWLWERANESESQLAFRSPVIDIAVADQRDFAIAVCRDGSVHRVQLAGGRILGADGWNRGDLACLAGAVTADGQTLAVGTRTGEVLLLDPNSGAIRERLTGHDDAITDLAFTVDGRLISASDDRTIAAWDIDSLQMIDRGWHISAAKQIAVQQNGLQDPVIVVAVSDSRIGRAVGWRLGTEKLRRMGSFQSHRGPVSSVALTGDGSTAASGDADGSVFLWAVEDLRETDYDSTIENAIAKLDPDRAGTLVSSKKRPAIRAFQWKAHADAVNALRFDDAGTTLLSASDDYTIRIWDTADRSLSTTLRGHGGWVNAIDLAGRSNNGTAAHILSGSNDGSLRSWDPTRTPDPVFVAESEKPPVRSTQAHPDEILAARLDRTGTRVISASRDHTARILELDRARLSFREVVSIRPTDLLPGELAEGTAFLALSTHVDEANNRLFVGNADASIRLWDLASGTQQDTFRGTGLNTAFALSADGRRLLSGSSEGGTDALLWNVGPDVARKSVLHRLTGHQQAVTAYALTGDGSIAVTGDRGGRCLIWDATTGTAIGKPVDLLLGFRINEFAVAPDNRSLWIAADNGDLTEIELPNGRRGRRLEHQGFVTAVSVSPNGDEAVTISQVRSDRSSSAIVTWWDLSSKRSKVLARIEASADSSGKLRPNADRFTSARFGRDGKTVVICRESGDAGSISLVGVRREKSSRFEVPSQIGTPEGGILLRDGDLITLNGEAAFRWNVARGVHETSYRPHADVTAAAFSPDGKIAATASRSIRLWNAADGEGIDKLEVPHDNAVSEMVFSPRIGTAGYVLATCGNDPVARIWTWKDRASGFLLRRELAMPGSIVSTVAFSPDGQTLLSGSADGAVQLWKLTSKEPPLTLQLPSGAAVTCASFSRDGQWLAVGSDDRQGWVFNLLDPKREPIVLQGHADRIESIKILEDDSQQVRILTASRDKSARVWDPRASSEDNRAREVLALRRHSDGVTAIDCTDNGQLVITAGRDGKVLLWPARN